MLDIADTDVIEAFLSRTTYKSLAYKLGCKGPRTTKELLDIATSHTLVMEVVEAIFNRPKGKAKQDKDVGEGASNRLKKEEQAVTRGFAHGCY